MGVPQRRAEERERDADEQLLEQAREQRVRHETLLRQAERRIKEGLDGIRRGTLRVVD